MKKLGFLLLSLFVLFGIAIGFLESPIGRRFAQTLLINQLQNSGLSIEIGAIEGTLPTSLDFKRVHLQGGPIPEMTIDTLHIELSLSHLLRRQIFFNTITADGVHFGESPSSQTFTFTELSFSVQGTPDAYSGTFQGEFFPTDIPLPSILQHPWSFEGTLDKRQNEPLHLHDLVVKSDRFKVHATAELDSSYRFAYAHAEIESHPLSAVADFVNTDDGIEANATWHIPSLNVHDLSIQEAKGNIRGLFHRNAFTGDATASAEALSETWQLRTGIAYRTGGSLTLDPLQLDSPLLDLRGELALQPDGLWVGKLSAENGNFQALRRWRPSLDLYGIARIDASLDATPEGQSVQATIDAKEFYWKEAYAREASLCIHWLPEQKANLILSVNSAKWEEITLHCGFLSAATDGPFHLTMDGTLRDPVFLDIDGDFRYRENELLLALDQANGEVLHHQLLLTTPALFRKSEKETTIEGLNLSLDDATFSLSLHVTPGEGDARLAMQKFPLDLLSLNPLQVSVGGTLTLDAELHEKNHQTSGHFKASTEHVEVDAEEPLTAYGLFEGTLDQQQLHAKGNLLLRERPLLTFDTSLPFSIELNSFSATPLLDAAASGHLIFQGGLQEILDFVDLGTHRFTGDCTADLTLHNTLGEPRVEGYVRLDNGSYENYLTGTELTCLQADFDAQYDRLHLRSLTGYDARRKGTLSGTGSIHLSPRESFPFHFDLLFSELSLLQIDLISTTAEGSIAIDGNWKEATARGNLQIQQSEVSIPEKLPRPLPDLKVIYKNAPKPAPHFQKKKTINYPLHLDLRVQAPSSVFIQGRGLNSEWKGDFALAGTFTSPQALGKLELLNGDFLFSSRAFHLTEGALSFSGKEHEMPHLNIAGSMEEHGISITVRLHGPLNRPQITFHSIPALPLSSILSYLLFGQDLSEITAFQAVQLASSVSTLSGQSPDLLEATRKSLGIDRLRIISTPSGVDKEGETVSIQVGKYVARGVIVSVSQGAENSSTNISIEVDLTHGFTFLAETDQLQEQGKFGFKWILNY
ncbi:MAG: translocation/assembly module TamB [Verrucomicrobiota bacterium]|nr:translocation/assembly module TamB [Verrucomicrobiota bacterium]